LNNYIGYLFLWHFLKKCRKTPTADPAFRIFSLLLLRQYLFRFWLSQLFSTCGKPRRQTAGGVWVRAYSLALVILRVFVILLTIAVLITQTILIALVLPVAVTALVKPVAIVVAQVLVALLLQVLPIPASLLGLIVIVQIVIPIALIIHFYTAFRFRMTSAGTLSGRAALSRLQATGSCRTYFVR
jgi:hypothetical protein